jgi:hypothetical protein
LNPHERHEQRFVAHDPVGVAVPGQVFLEDDISWPPSLHSPIPHRTLDLAREHDPVHAAGGGMPIGEIADGIPGESDTCGTEQGCLLPAPLIHGPRAGDVFEVGLSVVAGVTTNDHLRLLFWAPSAEPESLDSRAFWWGG